MLLLIFSVKREGSLDVLWREPLGQSDTLSIAVGSRTSHYAGREMSYPAKGPRIRMTTINTSNRVAHNER